MANMKLTPTILCVLMAAWATVLCGKSGEAPQQPEAPAESVSRFAALDDVRLLANGLLQLGQSLREFVQKTKGQINAIFQKLNIFDRSFYQLSVLASEIKEEEEELKKTTVVLKANNEEIKTLSMKINSKVESILEERSQLKSKVGGLEEKLSSLSNALLPPEQLAEIRDLKGVIRSQEQSISELLRAVREQSDQLNNQRIKIKSLEKITYSATVQDTIVRTGDVFSPEVPTLTPYQATDPHTSSGAEDLPSDCSDLFNRGERISGLYTIRSNGSEPFNVFCDMNTDGGAVVIQRRTDGSVNFDQTWQRYENGFGDFQGEFWLGLRKIHSLVRQGHSLLRVHLEDWKQGSRYADYSCSLEGPESNYIIHLSEPTGNLPDAMANHTGMMFSTKDRDNDNHQDSNCASEHTGGWWFSDCGDANLNGRYVRSKPRTRSERRQGIHWRLGGRSSYSLRATQISIRPRPPPSSTSASSPESDL